MILFILNLFWLFHILNNIFDRNKDLDNKIGGELIIFNCLYLTETLAC